MKPQQDNRMTPSSARRSRAGLCCEKLSQGVLVTATSKVGTQRWCFLPVWRKDLWHIQQGRWPAKMAIDTKFVEPKARLVRREATCPAWHTARVVHSRNGFQTPLTLDAEPNTA
eukprot:365653-Chlamydomonas_euryale.AAC.1